MRHLRQLCSILFIFGLASCAYKQVVWPQEPWVEPFMGLDYWIRATFPKSDRASATPTYVRVWAALEPENYYLCDSGGEEIVCFFPFKIVDSLSFFGRWPPEYEVKETDRESDPHHCDERR
ncbi:MAG TPA: hypothetical protein VJA27_02675, partial [Patescibacteria group bacterium]|nr:hypothetical protein [Patescibacteria group bacterium]